jgi:hypothetical protein
MLCSKRTRLGAIIGSALFTLFGSHKADATPVIPPGFSAAILDANIDAGYNPITRTTIFVRTTNNTGYSRYSTEVPGPNEFIAVVPPMGGVVQSVFAAGVIAGLPGDPAGPVIDHLVVFGGFTPAELNMSFASLFPNISESTLINDLLTIPANQPFPAVDINPFIADALADGLYGGNGSSFSAVAFSGGTDIGNGTITFLLPTSVPEPMSVCLFAAGLAGVSVVRRRKKGRVA